MDECGWTGSGICRFYQTGSNVSILGYVDCKGIVMKLTCKSVWGGWQSMFIDKRGCEWLFGPVFNKASDLWAWQKENNVKGE